MNVKLIDILVEELPKRGGWPEGSTRCMQTDGLYVTFPDIGDHCDFVAKCMAEGPRIATREQYEAALAASKPEWDGQGLPPVGCECEGKQLAQLNWNKFKVVAIENGHVFGFWNDNVSTGLDSRQWEFRPIRSEADKKRDEAVKAMANHKNDPVDVTENHYHAIYDAIAAGKIPHIRID